MVVTYHHPHPRKVPKFVVCHPLLVFVVRLYHAKRMVVMALILHASVLLLLAHFAYKVHPLQSNASYILRVVSMSPARSYAPENPHCASQANSRRPPREKELITCSREAYNAAHPDTCVPGTFHSFECLVAQTYTVCVSTTWSKASKERRTAPHRFLRSNASVCRKCPFKILAPTTSGFNTYTLWSS